MITCRIVNFAVAGSSLTLKVSEKGNTYLDVPWEVKNLWNVKVSVLAIIVGALETINKGWKTRLEE